VFLDALAISMGTKVLEGMQLLCPTNQGEATRMVLHGVTKTQLEKVCISSASI